MNSNQTKSLTIKVILNTHLKFPNDFPRCTGGGLRCFIDKTNNIDF